MSFAPEISSLAGIWTYRSFLNHADLATDFDKLEFGRAGVVCSWYAVMEKPA